MTGSEGAALSAAGFEAARAVLGVLPARLWAILTVETCGCGFGPDRRPAVLFERQVFHARTGGAFAAGHPDLCHPEPGGYGASAAQHERLARAIRLDRDAALRSTRWGLGQVLGLDAARAGFRDIEAMIAAMSEGEDAQLLALARFIAADARVLRPLRAGDWTGFARGFNGPDFARDRCDIRLEVAYRRHAAGWPPDLEVRELQLLLTYLGHGPLAVDGRMGPATLAALNASRKLRGRAPVDRYRKAELTALRKAAASAPTSAGSVRLLGTSRSW